MNRRVGGLENNLEYFPYAQYMNRRVGGLESLYIRRGYCFRMNRRTGGSEISYDEKTKPRIANLLTIYSLITQQSIDEIVQSYQGKGCGYLKVDLAEALIEHLRPLQEKQKKLINDKAELDKILAQGAKTAQQVAQQTLDTIHQKIGFI
jgi:tryptophanyl-tRNA synthetase